MLTREATYEDYGFSEDEDKRLGEFCKNLEMRDKILLLQCAAEVYPNIVDELYCCIVSTSQSMVICEGRRNQCKENRRCETCSRNHRGNQYLC